MTRLSGLFHRRPSSAAVTTAPAERRGWVAHAYGSRAEELLSALRALMAAAGKEADEPSISRSDADPGRSQNHRGILSTSLDELRTLVIRVDVVEADVERDRRLRAALAEAVGAARSLALASSSQPTAGYLSLTRSAVDGVLSAAGEPALR